MRSPRQADRRRLGRSHRVGGDGDGEWMYVFDPLLGGTVLYVKIILRSDCMVISFHEDEGGGHEEDDA